jgi:glycosyltransferase involved in cell wall biosynthesis
MKLVVQIPCYNEETTLPVVLESIPKKIAGIDEIIIQIMDDASTDKTIEVAQGFGVKHIVRHAGHVGLGKQLSSSIPTVTTNIPSNALPTLYSRLFRVRLISSLAIGKLPRSPIFRRSRSICNVSAAGLSTRQQGQTSPMRPAAFGLTRASRCYG